MLSIRLATFEDINQIMLLVRRVTELLNQQGNYQWDKNYPQQSIFEQDIRQKTLFVAHWGQQLLGVVCINTQQAAEYSGLNWQSRGNDFYVIHRLAVDALHQMSGIGKALLHFADQHALLNNKQYIKADTFEGNEIANSLFAKQGYQYKGNIQYEGYKGGYCCYEKQLVVQ